MYNMSTYKDMGSELLSKQQLSLPVQAEHCSQSQSYDEELQVARPAHFFRLAYSPVSCDW